MAKNQEVAKVEDSNQLPAAIEDYALMHCDTSMLQEIIKENLGHSVITEFDFDRIKVPTGGNLAWTVPTLEGEEVAKEVEGIIVHWKDTRAYWKTGFDESGGGTPPDCCSPDGLNGIGEPGGDCMTCPLAQFGSDDKGRGQACKAMRVVFLLGPNALLPQAIIAPPTSLQNMRKYNLRLAQNMLRPTDVVTAFGLEGDKNADGIKYAKVVPKVKSRLTPDEVEKVRAFAEQIRPALQAIVLDQSDFSPEA